MNEGQNLLDWRGLQPTVVVGKMKAKRVGVGIVMVVLLYAVAGLGANDFVIRVHLINGRTGKPIAGKPVQVWSLRARRHLPPGTISGRPTQWRVKTDSHGVAAFRLPGPPDFYVEIHLGMGGYWEECRSPTLPALKMLKEGFVNNRACPAWAQKSAYNFRANPGDVYFFAVHLTLWERIKHCNEWGCNK